MIIRLFIYQHTYIASIIYKYFYKNGNTLSQMRKQFPDLAFRGNNTPFSDNF